jgi:FG-GAP repeat protein
MNTRTRQHPYRLMCSALLVGLATLALPARGQVLGHDDKLLAADSAAEDFFGFSVGVGDGIVAVGAYRDDDHGTDSGAVYLYDAATGSQLFKLTASDGAANDIFGWSVAVDNGIVVVGARGDDANGAQSGSAYVFNASTGMQIAKILPNDGASGDFFGYSVAIDNGVIVVGAIAHEDNGVASGAAYLFNATTGAEFSKLLASDGSESDSFGFAVGIGDGVVAVGAPGGGVNDNGAAYIFNATTGTQIAKLVASDGEPVDLFGRSIDVDKNVVVVGAMADDDGGFGAGAIYLFNASTGAQTAKILAGDPAPVDQFGWSVAISEGIVAIGAHADDDNGTGSGSVYLFDASTHAQIAKLLPDDGLAGDFFGESVSIDNGVVAVGAYMSDDNGIPGPGPRGGGGANTDFGAAYVFFDADDDGLTNIWELIGVPYAKTDGSTGRYLLDYDNDGFKDSNPNHKDLFVEIDSMVGLVFSGEAVTLLEDAFRDAPVTNPGGEVDGINLFLQIDEQTVPFEQDMAFPNSGWSTEIGTIKGDFFGTAAEHNGTSSDEPAILAAKKKAYRYCLLVNKIKKANGKRIGGRAELPGDDLVMSFGSGTKTWLSSTFMHELGHNLNLRHGGVNNTNMKPNYPSIMNYALADPMPWSRDFWKLDYSREELDPLDESSLDESVSLGDGGSGFYDAFCMPYYSVIPDGAACYDQARWGDPLVSYATLEASVPGVDFNLDCDEEDTMVAVDLNYYQSSGLPGTGSSSPGQPLVGQNDWAVIQLAIPAGGSDFGDAPAEDELTLEGRQFIMDNFPIPSGLCEPDLTGDGILDFFDVQLFLNLYAEGEVRADFAFDGVFDFFDVQEFLNLYSAGCP